MAACAPSDQATSELDPADIFVRQTSAISSSSTSYSGSSLQGAAVSGEVEVFINGDGWMKEVWYSIDSVHYKTLTTHPFATTIDTTKLTDGKHVLGVEPRMPNGRARDVLRIEFFVNNHGTQTPTPANQAPSASVGEDITLDFGGTAQLRVDATDDGLPNGQLSVRWSKVSGPGTVTFREPTSVATTATFSAAGVYEIRATVDDGELRATDSLSVTVKAPVAEPEPQPEPKPEPKPEPQPEPQPGFDRNAIVWYADMEGGDLSQWSAAFPGTKMECGGPQNNSGAQSFASKNASRSGSYSAALRIANVSGDQGARLHRGRCEGAAHPDGLYYGVWYFVPQHHSTPAGWWNVFQFKSKPFGSSSGSDPMWVLDLVDQGNGTMALRMRDKVSGSTKYHGTTGVAFPTGKWVHLEAFFRGSWKGDGEITVWQDGVQIFSKSGLNTIREGDIRWGVNNYSSAIRPDPSTIYIDDATISTKRVGPNVRLDDLF